MLKVRDNREGLNRRIDFARVLVGAVFAILAMAYWYTQIVRGDYYYTLSESNRIRSVRINAPRGYVLDRNGAVLVDNEPAYTLHMYRREAKNIASAIDLASEVLKVPREQIKARVDRGLKDPEFLPITIGENLGIEEVAAIEAHAPEHPEFAITISQRRLYTRGAAAAHVLGYLSEASLDQVKSAEAGYRLGDWIGQKGIEGAYEGLLAGVNGERRVVVDSHGREMAEERRVEARPGQNLFVTLDLGLQQVAEDYFKDKVGAAVALDPRTGEILALVSSPSYDPNWFTRRVTAKEWAGLLGDADHPLQNRAIQNAFSPGSTFKVFLAYGALAAGLVDPEETVFCPGYATYYGRVFHCHKKGGHGTVNLRNAIKMSCDVYFFNLGHRLGIDRISEIAKSFGFGTPTGVDLPYEKSGLVPSEQWAIEKRKARWYPSETISVSIGQGPVLVTTMQLARALSAVVLGKLPTPHLFLASQEPHSGRRLRYNSETKPGLPIDPAKLRIVKDGMWAVMNEAGGTAYGSRVPGLEAGGKTGTTQVIGHDSTVKAGADKSKLQDHAWFAGFAPVDDPQIVVAIFVENGGHGNLAAAPLAKLLFAKKFGKPVDAPAPPQQRASAPAPRVPPAAPTGFTTVGGPAPKRAP